MSCDIIIRNAEPSDLEQLCRLEQNNGALCYSEGTLKSLFGEDSVILVAEMAEAAESATNGDIIGYIAVSIVFEDADLINIAVEKEWRRCGIGAALLGETARECVRLGAKRVLLEVSEDNSSAISFYRGLGFEQIFLRPKYYGELSALVMQLALDEKTE